MGSVAEHSVHRQSWINELDVTLDQVEIDRGDLVSRLITVSYFYLYQDKFITLKRVSNLLMVETEGVNKVV